MYTISLVANKLGKNMLVFDEDFSYSQDAKNVLLLKAKIIKFISIPRAIKNEELFLFVWNASIYQNNMNRQIVVLIDRQNTGILLDAVKITATRIACDQALV